jgi:hypothetical protein
MSASVHCVLPKQSQQTQGRRHHPGGKSRTATDERAGRAGHGENLSMSPGQDQYRQTHCPSKLTPIVR